MPSFGLPGLSVGVNAPAFNAPAPPSPPPMPRLPAPPQVVQARVGNVSVTAQRTQVGLPSIKPPPGFPAKPWYTSSTNPPPGFKVINVGTRSQQFVPVGPGFAPPPSSWKPSFPGVPAPLPTPAMMQGRIPALPSLPSLPSRITLPPVITPPEVAAKVLEKLTDLPLTVKGGQIMPEVGPSTSGDETAAEIEEQKDPAVAVTATPPGKEVTGDVSVTPSTMSTMSAGESGGIPTWAMAAGAAALAGGVYWFFIRKK